LKKLLIGIAFIAFFASQTLWATPKIFKPHKGLKGKDDASVNCAYCHTKASVEKKKGQDKDTLYKSPYCAIAECHPPKK
jgi:hypothetical protein